MYYCFFYLKIHQNKKKLVEILNRYFFLEFLNKNKILKQDNEYSRRYYDILLKVQIIHKELLKDLFNILDMLEMSLTINNSKLNELILVTINKVNEAELLCKEFFRDAIISILQNDFKQ